VIGLFFEQKSTRTRLGFEVAAINQGHHAIDLYETEKARMGKTHGESFEDHVQTVSQYCDLIIARSNDETMPKRIAQISHVPVINAGNGVGEHPTQAMVDIFTIEEHLGCRQDISIALSCDPLARHALSFVKLLSLRPPKTFTICLDPKTRLQPDMQEALGQLANAGTRIDRVDNIEKTLGHDILSLQTQDVVALVQSAIGDAEKPRHIEKDAFTVTAEKIRKTGSKTLIINPLPRFTETDTSCDSLPNAVYFEQVRLSTFIRMAVLERMLSGRLWSRRTPASSSSGWSPASSATSSSLLQSVS
jgi:aspartate carbamoyltransferase catalytic subunit